MVVNLFLALKLRKKIERTNDFFKVRASLLFVTEAAYPEAGNLMGFMDDPLVEIGTLVPIGAGNADIGVKGTVDPETKPRASKEFSLISN